MANMAAEVAASMARIKALQAALTRPKFDDEEESEEAEMARQFAEQEQGWDGWVDDTASANHVAAETKTETQNSSDNKDNTATNDTANATAVPEMTPAPATDSTTITATNTTDTTTPTDTNNSTHLTHRTASSIITESINDKENNDTVNNKENTDSNNTPTHNTTTTHTRTHSKPAKYNTLQPIHEWTNIQCIEWLDTIKAKLLSYQYIFVNKGWSNSDIVQWNHSIDTVFVQYIQYWTDNKIDGTVFNDANDDVLLNKCHITEQYHRALMLSNLRQYKRKTMTRQ